MASRLQYVRQPATCTTTAVQAAPVGPDRRAQALVSRTEQTSQPMIAMIVISAALVTLTICWLALMVAGDAGGAWVPCTVAAGVLVIADVTADLRRR